MDGPELNPDEFPDRVPGTGLYRGVEYDVLVVGPSELTPGSGIKTWERVLGPIGNLIIVDNPTNPELKQLAIETEAGLNGGSGQANIHIEEVGRWKIVSVTRSDGSYETPRRPYGEIPPNPYYRVGPSDEPAAPLLPERPDTQPIGEPLSPSVPGGLPRPIPGVPGIGTPRLPNFPGIEPGIDGQPATGTPGGYGTPHPDLPGRGVGAGGRQRRTGGGSESQPYNPADPNPTPDPSPQPQPNPTNPLDPENFVDDDCCGASGQREILRRLEDVMHALKLNPGLIDLTNCDGSGSVVATLDNFADKVTAIETALSHLNGNTKCSQLLAIPESFETKAPKIRAQCIIQWKPVDSSSSSRWNLTIPHFNEGFKDSITLPSYRKGDWICTLQLENNSHIIVNAFNEGEGRKILEACLGYILPEFANNADIRFTKTSRGLFNGEVEPVYAKYYIDGDRKQPPQWVRSLS